MGYVFGISITGSDLLHVHVGLNVPSQQTCLPPLHPQTPSCQEQHPRARSAAPFNSNVRATETMQTFDILKIDPTELKVHLAVGSIVRDDPLDLYFDGSFKVWQEDQNKRNFQRKYIFSLIRFSCENLWLFAGIYLSKGIYKTVDGYHFYETELTDIGEDLRGRLIVEYKRKGRNSYPKGESLTESAVVYEVKPEPLAFSEFQNFNEVNLTRSQLELLFNHQYPPWKSALTSFAGVYLISDKRTGKLYVGSAYGQVTRH